MPVYTLVSISSHHSDLPQAVEINRNTGSMHTFQHLFSACLYISKIYNQAEHIYATATQTEMAVQLFLQRGEQEKKYGTLERRPNAAISVHQTLAVLLFRTSS